MAIGGWNFYDRWRAWMWLAAVTAAVMTGAGLVIQGESATADARERVALAGPQESPRAADPALVRDGWLNWFTLARQ